MSRPNRYVLIAYYYLPICCERERPIENYGKKEQKEWLDNILPDPHPCTTGNKEEEHNVCNSMFLWL